MNVLGIQQIIYSRKQKKYTNFTTKSTDIIIIVSINAKPKPSSLIEKINVVGKMISNRGLTFADWGVRGEGSVGEGDRAPRGSSPPLVRRSAPQMLPRGSPPWWVMGITLCSCTEASLQKRVKDVE